MTLKRQQKETFKKAYHGVLALNGQEKDVKQKIEKGHHVNVPPNYKSVDADFMEVQAQVQGLKKA